MFQHAQNSGTPGTPVENGQALVVRSSHAGSFDSVRPTPHRPRVDRAVRSARSWGQFSGAWLFRGLSPHSSPIAILLQLSCRKVAGGHTTGRNAGGDFAWNAVESRPRGRRAYSVSRAKFLVVRSLRLGPESPLARCVIYWLFQVGKRDGSESRANHGRRIPAHFSLTRTLTPNLYRQLGRSLRC